MSMAVKTHPLRVEFENTRMEESMASTNVKRTVELSLNYFQYGKWIDAVSPISIPKASFSADLLDVRS